MYDSRIKRVEKSKWIFTQKDKKKNISNQIWKTHREKDINKYEQYLTHWLPSVCDCGHCDDNKCDGKTRERRAVLFVEEHECQKLRERSGERAQVKKKILFLKEPHEI